MNKLALGIAGIVMNTYAMAQDNIDGLTTRYDTIYSATKYAPGIIMDKVDNSDYLNYNDTSRFYSVFVTANFGGIIRFFQCKSISLHYLTKPYALLDIQYKDVDVHEYKNGKYEGKEHLGELIDTITSKDYPIPIIFGKDFDIVWPEGENSVKRK